MQIKQLKYHQIDFVKYDNCIKNAYNHHIYAYSWYLDIVTKQKWELLVLNNYEAVMPLPFARLKRALFIKKITQPLFCQQLGVFSLSELNQDTFNLFIKNYKKLLIFKYQFNHFNNTFLKELSPIINKVNYELNLNKPYSEIRLKFNKNLNRNLKKASKNKLKITQDIEISQFLDFKDQHKTHKISKGNYSLMKRLLTQIIQLKAGNFYGVLFNNKIIAIGFFVFSNNRIIHLFSASSKQGKIVAGIPFLFDYLIQKHANTNLIFDFEGSMITGVAQFFKSFGAMNNSYICHQC